MSIKEYNSYLHGAIFMAMDFDILKIIFSRVLIFAINLKICIL